jgi:hypothetical protein
LKNYIIKRTAKIFWKEAKMKTLTLIFCCLLLLAPCQAAENQSEQDQLKPEEIDKYISQQRVGIENYYNGQLIELGQRVQSEIRLLEVADEAVYASLAAQAEVAKWVLHIDSYGYLAPWYLAAEIERKLQLKDDYEPCDDFKDSIRNSPKRFAVAKSLIAERKSRISAQLEWEILKLEQHKQYALTDGLAQLEKQLKENVLIPKPEATHGMVTGILYSTDKPSATIDRKIVHQGDTIQGVNVVKIFRDKVVFAKKGRGWDQKVGEKPGASW